ncbi:HPr kinase/phosphorylase [Candidatus Bilamarchaeum dharawalense]|uniref:HPr kinase/phosphorylase n=1 Tax=Candidatus Bilamarchaeum dharawalense TaxID=2885759 RepID=A0A5E4LTG0_9ARCH|nr:HPr kinase/phosphorylase [Candidatus Bilamarchaeum dharawalense]
MANYKVEIISIQEKDKLMTKLVSKNLIERKAVIHGTCVKFFTDNHQFKDMWEDNFELMPDWIRPHARIFSVSGKSFSVKYEPLSKTVIIVGCSYYGWIKSIALALVADFMEDFTSEHRRYSVHGSFVDVGGRGLAIIGPSGSGKTTLTYGLLLDKKSNFVTDDWFFVRLAANEVLVYSSEKNSYVRGDLAKSWPQYKSKLDGTIRDHNDRAIVDVKRLVGSDRIRADSILKLTVLLTRDKKLPVLSKLSKSQALSFMQKNDFCNPHQLVRSKIKTKQRTEFFGELFTRAPVYLLNTIETPEQSLKRLKTIIAEGV